MKQRFARVVFATLLWLLPHQAFSQTTDAGITLVGLASFQPVDDSYVGGPYLSEGLGGIAPGFGIGGDVIFPNGLALAVEREDVDPDGSESFPFVITGGADVIHAFNARVSFLAGARYSYIDRPETLQYLGIGPHVLRANLGLRLRVN